MERAKVNSITCCTGSSAWSDTGTRCRWQKKRLDWQVGPNRWLCCLRVLPKAQLWLWSPVQVMQCGNGKLCPLRVQSKPKKRRLGRHQRWRHSISPASCILVQFLLPKLLLLLLLHGDQLFLMTLEALDGEFGLQHTVGMSILCEYVWISAQSSLCNNWPIVLAVNTQKYKIVQCNPNRSKLFWREQY